MGTGRLFVGTSGFAYKEWIGPFYPPGTKSAGMLGYYAGQFGSVEVNYTFRRSPTASMMEGWSAERTLALIEEHRVTHTHMVPTMFHRLLSLPDDVKARYDISSLVFIIHGAAPCPVEVKQRLLEWLGPIVWEYYAATEGAGTLVGPDEWLRKPGTVGRVDPPDHVRILDASGSAAGAVNENDNGAA